MSIERIIRLVAGTLVLVSVLLGAAGSPAFQDVRWLWLATFVGANLAQSAVTSFCPLASILRAAGVGRADPTLAPRT